MKFTNPSWVSMAKRLNILVVHGYSNLPLRASVRDLLYCYEKYAPTARCFYLNLHEHFSIPPHILKIDYDIIVFHTVFLSGRWMGSDFFQRQLLEKVKPLKAFSAVKIMHPQDEWIHTSSLCSFINEMKIDCVFSVAPETEWKKIYDTVDFGKVRFYKVLTGYLDERVIAKINSYRREVRERDLDIGYRAFKAPPWLGKHGFIKTSIADILMEAGRLNGFRMDISTKPEDTINGDDWYKFMLRCRYFIGVEGGSTVLDPEGHIWERGTAFMKKHPDASFEEVEKNCFPGLDGKLQLIAISPRHLEACATKTCQILVEGSYNGILKPGLHYLELKRDYSNLGKVMEQMKDEAAREKMVDEAYRDIVSSGSYSYRAFVEFIIEKSLLNKKEPAVKRLSDIYWLLINRKEEKKRWKFLNKKRFDTNDWKDHLKYSIFPRITGRLGKIMHLFHSR
jgi:hypothetical protein